MKDLDIVNEYQDAYRDAYASWQVYLAEAERDLSVYLGDQWDGEEKKYLREQRRQAMVFNKVHRVVHMVEGYQRKNRLSFSVDPVEASDEVTAEQLGATMLWVAQYGNIYNTISEAFSGAIKTGINLLTAYVDYTTDPVNGDIKVCRLPYNSFLLDPNFTQRDLSDCSYIIQRKYLRKGDLKVLLPGFDKDFDMMGKGADDGKFNFMGQAHQLYSRDLYAYDEYWKRTTKSVKYIINMDTAESIEFKGTREEFKQYKNMFPNVELITKQVPTVERHIIVNNKLIHSEEDPYGTEDFPHVPVMGFWDPEHWYYEFKLQGIVRCMRDPQSEVNRRRSQMLDILNSQINSGWIAKQSAVENPKDLYGSGQGKVVYVRDEAQLTDIMKIPAADIPQGMFALQEVFDRDIMEIPGANQELFGMAEKGDLRVAGVLAKLRQGAGITILQDLFDNLALSQKLLGQKIVKMIQNNFSAEKVKRIINEEPTPEFYNKDFGRYDCVCSEGVLTDTQRQLYYMQLMDLKQAGAPIPWTALLDAAPLQGKRRLQEMIAQEEQKADMQRQEALDQQKLLNEMAHAKMAADIAASEERRSQAAENRTGAELDRVNTLLKMQQLGDNEQREFARFVMDNQVRQLEMEKLLREMEGKMNEIKSHEQQQEQPSQQQQLSPEMPQ